mgnify:CR=1 FL=1
MGKCSQSVTLLQRFCLKKKSDTFGSRTVHVFDVWKFQVGIQPMERLFFEKELFFYNFVFPVKFSENGQNGQKIATKQTFFFVQRWAQIIALGLGFVEST